MLAVLMLPGSTIWWCRLSQYFGDEHGNLWIAKISFKGMILIDKGAWGIF